MLAVVLALSVALAPAEIAGRWTCHEEGFAANKTSLVLAADGTGSTTDIGGPKARITDRFTYRVTPGEITFYGGNGQKSRGPITFKDGTLTYNAVEYWHEGRWTAMPDQNPSICRRSS